MAIAPLPGSAAGSEGLGLDLPWPRPHRRELRLVAGDGLVPTGRLMPVDAPAAHGGRTAPDDVVPVAPVTWIAGSRVRHRSSEAVARRRRQVLLAVAVLGVAAALAAPVTWLGGRPATAPVTSIGASGVVATGATMYVVQPGDTLWSIAARYDAGGNPRPLAEALARETGSATVVPGERIAIP